MEYCKVTPTSTLGSFEKKIIPYRKPSMIILSIVCLTLFILGMVLRIWNYFNVSFVLLISGTVIFYGKDENTKKLALSIAIITASAIFLYFGFDNTSWHEWYWKIDIFAHFLVGIMFYFVASSLFHHQKIWVKFFIAIGMEIVYEIIEQSFGYFFSIDDYGLEMWNLIQDIVANIVGGIVGIFMEYVAFGKSKIPKSFYLPCDQIKK